MSFKRRKIKYFDKLDKDEAIKQINDMLSYLLSQPNKNKDDSFIRDLKKQRDDLKKIINRSKKTKLVK